MGSALRLGKVFGITINLHYSWFLIFAFFTYVLSYQLHNDQEYSLQISIIAGAGASLFLFASVVAHELAHSLVAINNGIPVKSITLFLLGGVAQITREASRPMTEMKMAIAGPLCSLILAGVFGFIWFVIWGYTQQTFAYDNPILWLAEINLALALFNLIPGFPLDGGRVLRAIIWQKTGNYMRATRIASITGKGFAYFLIAGGTLILLSSIFIDVDIIGPLQGLWFIFIGWFLNNAAGASYRQVAMRDALQGFTAQAVMSTDYVVIPPDMSLRRLVLGHVLSSGRRFFVVAEEGRVKGTLTLEDIKKIPQSQLDTTPVTAAMLPMDKAVSANPGEEALSVLERMDQYGVDQMPVARDGVVIGIIFRQNLLRFMKLRSELKV
ncbi:site-2 protease family protein [Chloroflexota bacterium]